MRPSSCIRRGTLDVASLAEIRILRRNYEAVLARVLPHLPLLGTTQPDLSEVARKAV